MNVFSTCWEDHHDQAGMIRDLSKCGNFFVHETLKAAFILITITLVLVCYFFYCFGISFYNS